jgi:hypothetical protein
LIDHGTAEKNVPQRLNRLVKDAVFTGRSGF